MRTSSDVYDRYELYRLIFPNGKLYIGIAKSAKRRWYVHRKTARRGVDQSLVYRALRKYGADKVRMEVLAAGSREYISDLEIRAIAAFGASDRTHGYNVHLGGSTSPMAVREVALKANRHPNRKNALSAAARKAIGDWSRNMWANMSIEVRADRLRRLQTGLANTPRKPKRGRAPRKSRAKLTREQRLAQLAETRSKNPEPWIVGGHWITDGTQNLWSSDGKVPDGWRVGLTMKRRGPYSKPRVLRRTEARTAQITAMRARSPMVAPGTQWITDGRTQRRKWLNDPMPEGFVVGMLPRAKTTKLIRRQQAS